jgi:transposase
VRRTWAPRGQTPVLDYRQRRQRLSVIAALSVSPARRRVRLHFQVQDSNVRGPHLVDFLRQLHLDLRRDIILVWDRLKAHQSAARQLLDRGAGWLQVEWLPPYAPELNPTEYLWSHTKYHDLANRAPDDKAELDDLVNESLCDHHDNPKLLRSFIRAAELPL